MARPALANPLIMRYYNQNPRLKAHGIHIRFTPQQIQERILCTQNPIYFMEKYIKIVDVDEGLVPFNMFPFQKELVTSYIDNRFTIGCLSRQLGKSTVTIAFILWMVLFGPMHSIAILANKANTARDILAKLQLAYEHIPLWMQQGIKSFNKGSIELENGSKVIAGATSSSAARGGSYSCIFLDEFAFVGANMAKEFFTSVFPTISSGETTKLIMISTPNGMNLFHKFYVDAKAGRNPYHLVEANWQARPERDAKWYKEQLEILGEEKFKQEHLCEFIGSSNTLISGTKLTQLSYDNPIRTMGSVDVYDEPDANGYYIACVDTGRGGGGDYSTISVFRCNIMPYKMVAKYRNNKINSYVFPEVVHNMAKMYNNAHVLVETNDVGKQVVDGLFHELEYENIFCTKNGGNLGSNTLVYNLSNHSKLGIFTTGATKKVGCSNLKALIETDKLIIPDKDTIEELYSFVQRSVGVHNNLYAAEAGKNDDMVMTLVLFAWLTNQSLFKDLSDNNIRKILVNDRMQTNSTDVLPFGILNDAPEEEEIDQNGDLWTTAPDYIKEQVRFFRDQDYTLGDIDDEFDGGGNL